MLLFSCLQSMQTDQQQRIRQQSADVLAYPKAAPCHCSNAVQALLCRSVGTEGLTTMHKPMC